MKGKYEVTYPAYYLKFACKAQECTDNCCIHWEIDIDPDTADYYQTVEGTLGERLKAFVEEGADGKHFVLDEEERCPFLNRDNLCDLICSLGEESLCQICRDHPRFFNWYEDGEEAGVGLCCEAAAALILDPAEEDTLITELYETPDCEPDPREAELLCIRAELLEQGSAVLERVLCSENFYREEPLRELLLFLQKQEILHDTWRNLLGQTELSLSELLPVQPNFIRTHDLWGLQRVRLYRYFLYRHGMREWKEEKDKDTKKYMQSKAVLAAACVGLAELFYMEKERGNGTLDSGKVSDLCKLFSQEMEYDDANMSILFEFVKKMSIK